MVFRKFENGHMAGDCTMPYKVELIGQPTLGGFIAQILEAGDEWGIITVRTEDGSIKDCTTDFKYSSIDTGAIAWAMNRKVLRASASGGWTRMDYVIIV